MITDPPREAVRTILREQAQALWAMRRVQGKVASLGSQVFGACLFPGWYTQCTPPPHWRSWCLPTDKPVLDLSSVLFRCVRAIGGGWSEQLHVDAPLALLAERWSSSLGLPSARTCPLCSGGPGTPRHVVMSCPAMRHLVDMLRDCLECELASLVQPSAFTEKASAWRHRLDQQGQAHVLGVLGRAEARRWPLLAMWRFLIPIPQRELTLSSDVGGSSAAAVASEAASDLGYRAVLCAEFGRALCSSVVPDSQLESDSGESFSVIFQPSACSQS